MAGFLNFLLITAGLALVFGVPAIIIRALNTRGKPDKRD